jgi:ribosomal protein L28
MLLFSLDLAVMYPLVANWVWNPEEDKWVTLKVSASALKNINKKGISAVMKEARVNGFLTK